MIVLQNIDKTYQTARNAHFYALKNVSLEVASGEIFGIVGRKSAGKSTLMRCINLLERPDRGNLLIDNRDLNTLTAKELTHIRRSMGMLTENCNLLQTRTIYDNVALPLEFINASKKEIRRIVPPLLNLMSLSDSTHLYPQQLNEIQKHRTALARALVHHPKILLCDNITASLDARTTHLMLKLLREIHQQFNLTLLFITSEMEAVQSLCHRMAVLHQGAVIEQGPVLNLMANPQSNFLKEWIKSATRLELPTALRKQLRSQPSEYSNPILRFAFLNATAQETLIAEVIQRYELNLNILQIYMEPIQENNLGIMVVEVAGVPTNIQHAMDSLNDKGLFSEVLGYVPYTA